MTDPIAVHKIILKAAKDLYPKLANQSVVETDWKTGRGWFEQLADRIIDDMDAEGMFEYW